MDLPVYFPNQTDETQEYKIFLTLNDVEVDKRLLCVCRTW